VLGIHNGSLRSQLMDSDSKNRGRGGMDGGP
jgi:hypothetical protein